MGLPNFLQGPPLGLPSIKSSFSAQIFVKPEKRSAHYVASKIEIPKSVMKNDGAAPLRHSAGLFAARWIRRQDGLDSLRGQRNDSSQRARRPSALQIRPMRPAAFLSPIQRRKNRRR
jgi:hypothetical protein